MGRTNYDVSDHSQKSGWKSCCHRETEGDTAVDIAGPERETAKLVAIESIIFGFETLNFTSTLAFDNPLTQEPVLIQRSMWLRGDGQIQSSSTEG